MPGPDTLRFLESMKIGYEPWHDGIGYDVQALAGMEAEDRAAVEALLIARLAGPGDWRDVEALAALGTPTALAAVRAAVKHRSPEVRNRAIEVLLEAGPAAAAELEDDLVEAVRRGAFELAEGHPTLRVKRALLDCVRLADPTTRVHAAAMLMFVCGRADEPFDWNQRPFFLRFATEESAELRAAWNELRERTGV